MKLIKNKDKKKEKIVENKTEVEKPLKEKENIMSKKPKRKIKIDLSIIIFVAIIVLLFVIVLLLTLGNGGNKYGNRLKGIDKISFTKKDKNKFVNSIKSNENVNSASIDIQGKIIYVIVDVKENVSVEDAQNIVNGSLENLSDAVKGFYDINALVTKKEEVPVETVSVDSEGKEKKESNKSFPISGYKNNSSENIVW